MTELNLSSCTVNYSFLSTLSDYLMKGRFQNLQTLKLANCKINDKQAIQLVKTVIYSDALKTVDLSRNSMGFKTGNMIVFYLRDRKKKGEEVVLKRLDL